MLLSRPGPVLPLATFAASVGVVFLFLHGVEGIGLLSTGWTAQYRIDLDVYCQAAQAWLTGRPLYTEVFPTGYGDSCRSCTRRSRRCCSSHSRRCRCRSRPRC